jgi:hypothetical protein
MAIGLTLGRTSPSDVLDPCYQAVSTFLERFSIRFEALSCLELTGVQLGTPEGQAAFKEKKQIERCTEYVGEAARMVMEIVEGGSKAISS